MDTITRQQLIISGVGGQGVLFVTRLLAETAIFKGLPVLTAETHGMAQRGGTVISHLKIGDFSSPMIRHGQADGMLALRAENIPLHEAFVKTGGWIAANSPVPCTCQRSVSMHGVDADTHATSLGSPKSANLILLGFTLGGFTTDKTPLFCTLEEIKAVLELRFSNRPKLFQETTNCLDAGYRPGN